MADPLSLSFPQPAYPYPTGYASLTDVQSRLNAGTWDPTKPTAAPAVGQVTTWLLEGTANCDVALATRGYFVPLAPIQSWLPPTGMNTYQGVGIGAWLLLRSIVAAYVVHYVEATRHGSQARNQDQNASHWMTIYDDFMSRVEAGSDNLAAFGVGGLFSPEIDISKGAVSGSLGAFLSDASQREGPIFTRGINWGAGLETTTTITPPQF